MSLTNPRVEYLAIRNAIIDLLNNNSTELNNGLKTNVKQVIAGNPFVIPVPLTMYPTIFVDLNSKSETFETLGGGRKEVKLNFSIYGIVRVVSSASDSDDEAIKLVDNIEAILRNNININGTVAYANPVDVDFGIGTAEKGVYVSMMEITLECVKRLK